MTKVNFVILVSGILLVVLGVIMGQHTEVLMRSISICLECVGIG